VAEGGEEDLKNLSQRHMVVRVEAKSVGPDSIKPLSSINGVEKVEESKSENSEFSELTFHCDGDARPAIAKALVGQGIDMLAMSRMDDGLESIFVKMVRQNDPAQGGQHE
jgi:ABC-type multidrug transport system ATPase subunit